MVAAITLAEIVDRLGGRLSGDGATPVFGVATLERAKSGEVSFLANPKYRNKLSATRAAAVILAEDMVNLCPVSSIITAQPYLYFARLAQLLNPTQRPPTGVDRSAFVESEVPRSVSVGPGVVIGSNTRIGENAVIGPGCVIGSDVEIGADAHFYGNVSVYSGCRIGRRVIAHSGAVIGADGFGFARDNDGAWVKIPQTGGVVIGDDVEIGANTTIDRGALDDTVIEEGVKLDNQIQVGHNVRIGAHSALAGCVGIAGSAVIGRRCTFGGGAIVLGHLEIADDVHVSAGTLVAKSITNSGSYTGTVPFLPHADWLRNFARLRHLDSMADKIRSLEAQVARLVAASEQKSS